MRYHKSKNRLIGIAIVLTTMLLFLIPTIGKGMIDGQFAMVNELYPTWHAAYRDVDETTIEKLAAHHDIAAYGLQSKVGSIVCEQASISMYYLDETGFSLYQNPLKEGSLPKAENENCSI